MESKFIANKMIDAYGMDVEIRKSSFSVDTDKDITGESYTSTIQTKAWVTPVSGYREIWQIWGYRVDADYSACFKSTVNIDINDIVILVDDTETIARDIVKHFEFNGVAFLEVVLGKVSTGI